MKLITIILPVYNVEKYIEDCVVSIINQTSNNFDLLIIDDGSKDASISIAERALKESDIEYKIIHRQNGGLSAARNTGIENAEGMYLVFVDSDDVITPDYIETFERDIATFNTDLCIANFKWVRDADKFDFEKNNPGGNIVEKKEFLKKILNRTIFQYFGCFCIKREYILKNNMMFDESVRFSVDQAYMWRLMANVQQYTYNYHKIYNYYERPGSIMTASSVDKMLTGYPSIQKCVLDLANNEFFDSNNIIVRWRISALHTVAGQLSYESFKKMYDKVHPNIVETLQYPDIKVKAIAFPMIFGPKALYMFLKRI